MIVREIAIDPDKVLADFDWFNDYEDTRLWCLHNCPDLVPSLDAGYEAWWDNRR